MKEPESRLGTTSFLVDPKRVRGDEIELTSDEARHAVTVLRVREADLIRVVDGDGSAYAVRVTSARPGRLTGVILRSGREVGELSVRLRMIVGIPKQRNRLEWLVEKLVELGTYRLLPIETARTQRASVTPERLARVVEAATKQCGRSRLMRIDEVATFDEAARGVAAERVLVCHEAVPAQATLAIDAAHAVGTGVDAWVGPEGGFSDEEIATLVGQGAQLVHLGARRLRTDTAAVAIAAILSTQFREPGPVSSFPAENRSS